MIQYIRWQAFIALSGIVLLLTVLGYLSTTIQQIVVPEPGGTYTEAIIGRPGNLNPLYLQTRADQDLAALLFNGLTRADARGELQPDLARSWEVSEDGQRYTFHLRDDAVWHDGTPVTVEDVRFTVGVMQDPDYTHDPAAADLWRAVQIEVEDEDTITFVLPETLAPFAPFATFTTFGILPRHLLQEVPVAEMETAFFSRQPVGTGPWKIARIEPNQIVLTPHLSSHVGSAPLLDEVAFRFYDDADSALQAFRRGDTQGVAQVMPENIGMVLQNPSLSPHPAPIAGYTALFFNLQYSLFNDRAVREALMLALDRQALIDEVLHGQGIVADTFLMPTHWAYSTRLPHYTYQPAEALDLLATEGWVDSDDDGVLDQDGLPLRFTILTNDDNPQLIAVAAEVAAQWRALGVQVEVRRAAGGELREALQDHEFDTALLATPQGGMPADPDFYPLWHSSQTVGAGRNYTFFQDDEADRLMVEARHTLDQEERRELYEEFQEILAIELPALPLYHPIYNYAVSDRVRNVQVSPLNSPADRFLSLPNWTIRTQRLLVTPGATPIP